MNFDKDILMIKTYMQVYLMMKLNVRKVMNNKKNEFLCLLKNDSDEMFLGKTAPRNMNI